MRYDGLVHDETVHLFLRWIEYRERAAAPRQRSWFHVCQVLRPGDDGKPEPRGVPNLIRATWSPETDDVESMGYCFLALHEDDQRVLLRKYMTPRGEQKPAWRRVLKALTRLQALAEQKGLVPPPEDHETGFLDEVWEFPTL